MVGRYSVGMGSPYCCFLDYNLFRKDHTMKIVTDCAADLTPEEIESLGISVAPLFIHFPEGEVSALEITPDQFYTRLRNMVPQIPTTAQPSAGIFSAIYNQLAGKGEEILSIHISSGLSGTINSARQGAEQATNAVVHFFDTHTLSGGERFQVLAAARAIAAGWGIDKILEHLDKIRSQVEVAYTLETLEYLARGGRIGRVQALAGTLLHLKPVIRVDHEDGKYSTVTKARTIGKALDSLVDHLAKGFNEKPVWVTILHGQYGEQAQALAALLSQRLNIAKSETLRISPVLGVHTGPGVVGAAVCPMELMKIAV
jgi:DegV family protein with EDD domain